MAYKIHINMISVRHLLTLGLVTLVMTYQFSEMHTASSLYLEKSKRYGECSIYLIIYMAAMLVFGGRWEYFTILYEILTGENVGIDTQNKSVDGLVRKIFVIE